MLEHEEALANLSPSVAQFLQELEAESPVNNTLRPFLDLFRRNYLESLEVYIRSQNTVESDSTDECVKSEYILSRDKSTKMLAYSASSCKLEGQYRRLLALGSLSKI